MAKDSFDDNAFSQLATSESGKPTNAFVLSSRNYASDQIMRCMASIMFHATIGTEFNSALLSMSYILKNPNKFMNTPVAFSMSIM